MQAAINRLLAAEAEQATSWLEFCFEWALDWAPGAPLAKLQMLAPLLAADKVQLQNLCGAWPVACDVSRALTIPTAAWAHYCAVAVEVS